MSFEKSFLIIYYLASHIIINDNIYCASQNIYNSSSSSTRATRYFNTNLMINDESESKSESIYNKDLINNNWIYVIFGGIIIMICTASITSICFKLRQINNINIQKKKKSHCTEVEIEKDDNNNNDDHIMNLDIMDIDIDENDTDELDNIENEMVNEYINSRVFATDDLDLTLRDFRSSHYE